MSPTNLLFALSYRSLDAIKSAERGDNYDACSYHFHMLDQFNSMHIHMQSSKQTNNASPDGPKDSLNATKPSVNAGRRASVASMAAAATSTRTGFATNRMISTRF